MKTQKLRIEVTDSRVDVLLQTKTLDAVFRFIEICPYVITLDRLEKFIKRVNKKIKQSTEETEKKRIKDEMDSYLLTRIKASLEDKLRAIDAEDYWSENIVLLIIDGGYLLDNIDSIAGLACRYGRDSLLKLAFCYFKDTVFDCDHRKLSGLKEFFSPQYVKKMVQAEYYVEVLTLVALNLFDLPKDLTKDQKEKFRNIVAPIVTTKDEDSSSHNTEMRRRVNLLFDVCPDLFTTKDIPVIALTGHKLAKEIYSKMSKECQIISQESISNLLDDEVVQEHMIWVILWYDIDVSPSNYLKIYDWVKNNVASQVYYSDDAISYDTQIQLCHALFQKEGSKKSNIEKKMKVVLSFDDFLEVLSKVDRDGIGIYNFYTSKLMSLYFVYYRDNIEDHCCYEYRSNLKDPNKMKLILDLFFWKELPWNLLHKQEKIAMNIYVNESASKYPRQSLLIANSHPSIITLSEEAKFAIFNNFPYGIHKEIPEWSIIGCTDIRDSEKLVNKGLDFIFDFGSNISNEIVLSSSDFAQLLATDIERLYKIIQFSQINTSKVWDTFQKPDKLQDEWWVESLYKLIMLKRGQFIPSQSEAFEMLISFDTNGVNDCLEPYFVDAWNLLPQDIRSNYIDLCRLEEDKKFFEKKMRALTRLLEYGFVTLDSLLVDDLCNLIVNNASDFNSQWLRSLEVDGMQDLNNRIQNQHIQSLLS